MFTPDSQTPVSTYGYTGDRTAIRDAIIGRAERNAAMIR